MPSLSEFLAEYGELLLQGTGETVVMLLVPTLISYVLGIALGVVLYLTAPGSLRPVRALNAVLGWAVNICRSFPFIVLMVSVIPLTRLIMGTGSGILGTIPPLVLSATPFIARMVEQSIEEVDGGLVEAAQSFGANTWQIVYKVFLREALPSLVRGFAIVFITILGYSAMAGCVGAGGLGDIAIRYGYQRYQDDVMIATVIILIVIVQIVQSACNFAARKMEH